MARTTQGVRCSVRDGDVGYYEQCEEPAQWIIQTLAMGYPSRQLVPQGSDAFCLGHFMTKMAEVVTERTKTTAGLRVIRLAHWLENEAPQSMRSRQIGAG